MRLPPPCDDEFGLLANRSEQRSLKDSEKERDDQSLQALDHYERAIKALVSTTYSGLTSPERRELLASLCREKQRLNGEHRRNGTRPSADGGASTTEPQ